MLSTGFRTFLVSAGGTGPLAIGLLLAVPVSFCGLLGAKGETVDARPKQVIGATATLTEVSSGIPFNARIDTGAKSCSLHVDEFEIIDEEPERLANVGKTIRCLITNKQGESKWIETTIAEAVRVRTSNDMDRRYKVRLTLQWNDFKKEVLVTLNNRTEMTYPLLIGRNYLSGDFLVDVDLPAKSE
jgi:hypothetical protein